MFKVEALARGQAVLFQTATSEEQAIGDTHAMLLRHRPRAGREIVVRRAAEIVARWLAGDDAWIVADSATTW
jgi:hypothetical protein